MSSGSRSFFRCGHTPVFAYVHVAPRYTARCPISYSRGYSFSPVAVAVAAVAVTAKITPIIIDADNPILHFASS